jgi:predicted RNA-binding protein with PUA-like domain
MPKQKKPKSEYEKWKWDIVDVEIDYDLPKKITLFFYGNIPSKKNSKRAFR